MIRLLDGRLLVVAVVAATTVLTAHADIQLIATSSISGSYQDVSSATSATLENGVPGNRLGGMGSAIAYAGGDTFMMLPDRGPNAVSGYGGTNIDFTVSYINRVQTFTMRLLPNTDYDPTAVSSGSAPFDSAGLPYIVTPYLRATTLLSSPAPLTYGPGGSQGTTEASGAPTRSGVPPLNSINHTHYFTGRSDGFDPNHNSLWPFDARLDTEGLRVSNDGRSVFISDEYGPYVYEFDRATGQRTRYFAMPTGFGVAHPNTTTNTETGTGVPVVNGNAQGRVANKGAEGLAITPDGRTLVVAMQSPLIQDGGTSGDYESDGSKGGTPYTRIVTIDIASGRVTHQYAYPLDNSKTAISELLAVNGRQFLIDERDGTGFETANDDNSAAKEKYLYQIDLTGASDVSGIADLRKGGFTPVVKSSAPFLDLVSAVGTAGIAANSVPAKIEGEAFGPDIELHGKTVHTLYVSNDNDFLSYIARDGSTPAADLDAVPADNPNRIFVFAFEDSDLPLYASTGLGVEPQHLSSGAVHQHHDAPFFGGFGPPSDGWPW
ncbi:MAG: esterase-like activity of phytase family protein [Steroidobacteraceae bacterium]